MQSAFALRVECYSGYRAEQEPRAFYLGERRIAVAMVVDRWLDTEHRYFKVEGHDGQVYILRHSVAPDQWELAFYSGLPSAS